MTYASEVLADSPVFYLKLEETSGDFLDSSGNSRSFTNIAALDRGVAGIADGGLAIQRNTTTTAGAQRASEAALQPAALTAEFLIKTTSTGVVQDIGGKWAPSGSQRTFHMQIDTSNRVQALLRTDSVGTTTTLTDTTGTVTITDGNWHQVAMSYDPATDAFVLYVDGAAKASTTVAGTTALVGTAQWNLMSRSTGGRGVDFLDDTSFYNTALSAARILAHYNALSPAVDVNLGVATETDSGLALEVADAVFLDVALETDVATGFEDQTIQLGRTYETDGAIGLEVQPKVARSFGQLNLVVYRYTPVSVNVGYEYGSVESHEYRRATVNWGQRTTDAGVPTPANDQRRP